MEKITLPAKQWRSTCEEVRFPAAIDRGSKTAFERTPSLTHTQNGH